MVTPAQSKQTSVSFISLQTKPSPVTFWRARHPEAERSCKNTLTIALKTSTSVSERLSSAGCNNTQTLKCSSEAMLSWAGWHRSRHTGEARLPAHLGREWQHRRQILKILLTDAFWGQVSVLRREQDCR